MSRRNSGKIGPVAEGVTKLTSNLFTDKYKAEKAENGQVHGESMSDIVRNIRECPYTDFRENGKFMDIYYQKDTEEAVKVGWMQMPDPSSGKMVGAGFIEPKAYDQIKKDAEEYRASLPDNSSMYMELPDISDAEDDSDDRSLV